MEKSEKWISNELLTSSRNKKHNPRNVFYWMVLTIVTQIRKLSKWAPFPKCILFFFHFSRKKNSPVTEFTHNELYNRNSNSKHRHNNDVWFVELHIELKIVFSQLVINMLAYQTLKCNSDYLGLHFFKLDLIRFHSEIVVRGLNSQLSELDSLLNSVSS